MSSQLSIGIFITLEQITNALTRLLRDERYCLTKLDSLQEFKDFVLQNKEHIDCLIILKDSSFLPILNNFYERGILLPVIIIEPEDLCSSSTSVQRQEAQINVRESPTDLYHCAEVKLSLRQLANIQSQIDRAIAQFLHLGPSCPLAEKPAAHNLPHPEEGTQSFLLLQQRRLAEKLKERLGYLGVYYNRNPSHFYRYLSPREKQELMAQLRKEYRKIILDYFIPDSEVNQQIDQFVNRAFFCDFSVSQILELHMELMDEFAQQLKLEGRNEEILLDYRLTLIDIMAHLCEMYRRSIPREDVPFEILFPVD